MAIQPPTESLLGLLRRRGTASAGELGEALDLSQPSISRALAAAGAQVARIGRARRTRYAAVRQVHGLGSQWPLYRIDAHGQAHAFGDLTALHGDGCLFTHDALPAWLQRDLAAGEFADGLFPGLPWFLDDQRPQGFLGRQFAHRFGPGMGLSEDIQTWDVDAVLHALLQHGDDEPGDFILGDVALTAFQRAEPHALSAAARAARYDALATETLDGAHPGSSAAGEQPKFTACIDDGGNLRHVIVKFSEPVDGNPAARRWADLLICEHLAGAILAEHRRPSARTEPVWSGGRLCLEVTRFDRVGAHGRLGFVTLAAWSDAHDGRRDQWPKATARMQQAGWLTQAAQAQVCERWWFGQLIGNTDMHFGNLGFFLADGLPLEPAPGYDMLPMLYRPAVNGAIVPRTLAPELPLPADLPHWRTAAAWASLFWQRVAQHPEISDEFHGIAASNSAILDRLRQRFEAATAP